jgi:hypothetical protein
MTASAPALVKSWNVGKRYRVTLTIPCLSDGTMATAVCEWEPSIPQSLTARELRDYERGRDAAVRQLLSESA